MLQATRTLVKSPPELWAEVADPAALETHLKPFGTVCIEATEDERVVRWSAEHAAGTLELEPAGFGTRVRLRAEIAPISEPVPDPVREPAAPAPRSGWRRLLRRSATALVPTDPSQPQAIPALPDEQVLTVLRETLEALGTAHHRPFSRA